MQLTATQGGILNALAQGARLRDHRDIDGRKWFDITKDDAMPIRIDMANIETLLNHKLIDSNKKFPAATYWLTDAGRDFVQNSGQ